MNLLDAYRFHRSRPMIRLGRGVVPLKATAAFEAARADVLAYRNAKAHLEDVAAIRDARREESNAAKMVAQFLARDGGPEYEAAAQAVTAAVAEYEAAECAHEAVVAAVSKATRYAPARPARVAYQERDESSPARSRERLAYVEKPEAFGLRFVGRVTPESHGGRDTWDTRESCGWHTDPYGDVFKDGAWLCFGVVYQLPARDGCARFVAGYEFGGQDGGPCLDLGNVYTSESARGLNCSYEGAQGHDDARDAARAADSMAERAAEREREYQTAWALGNVYAEARQEVTEARTAALALLKERRAAMAEAGANLPATCRAIRDSVAGYVETIRDARERMAKALEGDGPYGLCVYMGQDEKAAFCDAAGLESFPA